MTIISAYVAGPFSGKTRDQVEFNIKAAEQYGLQLAAIGVYPSIPHTNTSHPDFESLQGYEFWIEGTLDQMLHQDVLFCMPNWADSSGATKERAKALEVGMPIFYEVNILKEALPELVRLKQTFFYPISPVTGHWLRGLKRSIGQ